MTQTARSQRVVPVLLRPPDEGILRLLATYHYLTSRQICRALYAPSSLTRVQTMLKRLREAGFVQAIFLPRRTQRGSAPSVYTLAARGRRHLAQLGVCESRRLRPSEEREHAYLFLEHTLAVNDFLLAAAQLAQADGRFHLAGLRHERQLKQMPVAVTTTAGERLQVIPDAWLDLRVDGWQHCLVLELDRGTEEHKVWKRKVAGLVAYAMGPYQAAFNTDSLTVAVVTVAGQSRREHLVTWTEEELAASHCQALAGNFAVTSAVPDAVPPAELFLGYLWHVPFAQGLHPLIEV